MKKCSKCGEEKELSEFYSQEKINKNGEKYIYYRPDCKDCTKKINHLWQKENPENRKKYLHKYNTSEKGRNHFYKNNMQYRKDGRFREWQNKNKHLIKGYNEKRSLHKNHNISDEDLNEIYTYCNYSCMYCGITEDEHKKVYGQKLHKDHAINDGSNGIDNCILSCKSCNSEKSEKNWDEWYTYNNPKFTEERYIKIIEWLNKFQSNEIGED